MQWLEMAVRLPAAAMQLSIKALSDIWGAVQGNAAQGVDGMVSQMAHGFGIRPQAPPPDREAESSSSEQRHAANCCCLSNQCLKLIRYQVLFVKRGLEVAFPTREDLVWENLTGLQFQTWKVAEFVSELNDVPVPPKWLAKGYPPGKEQREIGDKQIWVIHALPPGDEKFLRVRCQLLRTYPRERLRFPEKQLEALAEIRDAIAPPDWTPADDSSPAGLLPAPSQRADSGQSSLLASEQVYQAVKAEAAVQEKAVTTKKSKAAAKAKPGRKKATKASAKPKAKRKAPAKAKRGTKKPARKRKRSGA